MFVNKIASAANTSFKGYQYVRNNVGDTIMRFNYPYNYIDENCNIQFFKLKRLPDYNYEVIEEPIATIPLHEGGVEVDLQSITNLDKNESFAYRYIRTDKATGKVISEGTDSGIMVHNAKSGSCFRVEPFENIDSKEFSFVSRTGTTPRVQGAGYLCYPDTQRVGVKYKSFDDPNTGEIYLDKTEQKDMESVNRNFSNKTGGNLAGMEYNIDYLAQNGYTIMPANPIAGADNKSSHHYWNKNNSQHR